VTSHLRSIVPNVQRHMAYFARVAWGRDGRRERSDSIRVLLQENTTVYYRNKLKSQRVMNLSTSQPNPSPHIVPPLTDNFQLSPTLHHPRSLIARGPHLP
jgi:hypothetical protein